MGPGRSPSSPGGDTRSARRTVIVALSVWLLALSVWLLAPASLPAAAATTLEAAEHHVRAVNGRMHDRRRTISELQRQLGRLSDRVARVRRSRTPSPSIRARQSEPMRTAERRKRIRAHLRAIGRERSAIHRRLDASHRALERLDRERAQTIAEIWRIRPIGRCPVAGPHEVADDFGAPRWDDGRYHSHMGNDITAAYGTPVVAPFDGRAVSASGGLGGLAVKVYGEAGYVYNGHLSRFGRLGEVTTGTVIGYVGSTGNAAGGGPHDHFEWHPGGGPAVDPNPFLDMVC